MEYYLRNANQLPSLDSLQPGQSFERKLIKGRYLNDEVLREDLKPGDKLCVLCSQDGDIVQYTIVGPAATVDMVPVEPHESIEVLDLRPSTAMYLRGHHLVLVGDLLEKTENQLLGMPNLGRKVVNEIKEALAARGRSLKEEPPSAE